MSYFSILLHQHYCLLQTCVTSLKCNTYLHLLYILLQDVLATLGHQQLYTLFLKLLHCHLWMSCVNTLFLILKTLKKFIKLLIQLCCIWLLGVGNLFFAVVCGYQFPAELVCSMCVKIIYYRFIKHVSKFSIWLFYWSAFVGWFIDKNLTTFTDFSKKYFHSA
jgi:hypothetical protein